MGRDFVNLETAFGDRNEIICQVVLITKSNRKLELRAFPVNKSYVSKDCRLIDYYGCFSAQYWGPIQVSGVPMSDFYLE